MNENFQELIRLLQPGDIRFTDSHETVLCLPENLTLGKPIKTESGQAVALDDPAVSGNLISFRMKYVFKFFCDDNPYFKAEYIVMISFTATDVNKAVELLKDEETKKIFLEKQVFRTLWTILRATIMNAFNRHSLPPVQLPWIV